MTPIASWDKRVTESADALFGSPFELAVVLGRRVYEIIRLQHCGVIDADGSRDGRGHPSRKPVVLFSRILGLFTSAQTILDPFLGSGTTAVAAKKLGRHFLGFEISEEYCRIARERIALVEAQPSLFVPSPEQLSL